MNTYESQQIQLLVEKFEERVREILPLAQVVLKRTENLCLVMLKVNEVELSRFLLYKQDGQYQFIRVFNI